MYYDVEREGRWVEKKNKKEEEIKKRKKPRWIPRISGNETA